MKFEDIKKLHQKKFREELGCFLLEGEHLVQELEKAAARDSRFRGSEIWRTHEYGHVPSALPTQVISARQFAQISETRSPQGVAAVVPFFEPLPPRGGERALFLHEIQDPGNLGTILRTLAWFGNFRCLLSPDSVDMHNGKVLRASMGAVFHVPVETEVSLGSLTGRFGKMACLDLKGTPITHADFRAFDCYLFGNEARGLPPEALSGTKAFTIPGTGVIDSLNVAATVNICLYEINRV